MELSIGQVIRQLRKQQNMTQEELALAVGVSIAAVSKWESEKSYPDITLLPSIARQLQTNVDSLFSYTTELDPEELERIFTQCSAAFDKASFEQGYALCREYLDRYPNDIALKLHIGTLIPMYCSGAPKEEEQEYLKAALELCKPAASSNDPKLRAVAQRMLTAIYLRSGKLDLAEEQLHACMDGLDGEVDPTLAVIYLKKGETEKAEDIYQRCLFRGVHGCQTALLGLAGIARTAGSAERFLRYQNSILRIAELFELENMPGMQLSAYLSLVQYYKEQQQEEAMVNALAGFVDCAGAWNEEPDFSNSAYFGRIKTAGSAIPHTTAMKTAFLEQAKELRGCAFFEKNLRFQALVERLERQASLME